MANMSKRKPPSPPMRVNVPAYPDYWNRKPYKNPNVVSMEIRINNAVPVTYVLKKFKDGSYKFSTYQKNQTSGCYFLVGQQTGKCINLNNLLL